MYPRGSIYNSPNRQWRVKSEHSQGIWKAKSQFIRDSMRKIPKSFVFMHISQCMRVLAQKLHVHTDIALKVVYTHKHVFFGEFLRTSNHNLRKGGLKSLQRDRGAINMWSTICGKISCNRFPLMCEVRGVTWWLKYIIKSILEVEKWRTMWKN